MIISPAPYKRSIPFVTIQEIRIDTDSEGVINIALSIANGVSRLNPQTRFSNYVYLTTSKEDLDNLSGNPAALLKKIKYDQPSSRSFSLAPGDFMEPPGMSTEAKSKIYLHTHSINRNAPPKTHDIYALVASYIKTSRGLLLGNIVREVIMLKGNSPTDASIYTLAETVMGYGQRQSVWPGSVHMMGDTLMAGNMHIANKHPTLQTSPVLNSKSKDMRILRSAQDLSIGTPPPRKPKQAYMSPVIFSRGKGGNVHGIFSFDHLNFARENTNFGFVLKSLPCLLASSQIKDVVIYQKVVQEGATSNILTPGSPIYCGISSNNAYKRVASLGDGLTIINRFNGNTIVNMSFIDKTTAELSGNLLEYKVEVILDDQTSATLSDTVDDISRKIKIYESSSTNTPAESIKMLIDGYLAALQVVYGAAIFKKLSKSRWQKLLMAMMSVTGSDPSSNRERTLKTIRDFCIKLKALLAPTKNIASKKPSFHSRIYNSNTIPLSHFVKVIPQKYRIPDAKDVGLEYVDNVIQGTATATPSISYVDMQSRAVQELEKFSINNPNAGFINKVGFLTPRAVSLQAKPISVPTTTLINNTLNFAPLIRSSEDERQVTDLETPKNIKTNTMEILNHSGVSVSRNESSLRKQVFDTKIIKIEDIDSSNYLSKTSHFVTVTTAKDIEVSGSESSILRSEKLEDEPATSELVVNLVNNSITSYNDITRVTNQINIKGSIALQKSKEDFNIIEQSDTMTNILNFGSVVQVQYLAGYGDGKSIDINKQNWILLDQRYYDAAVADKRPLICRLVKVDNTLDVPIKIKLQPLASTFILGTPPPKTATATYKQVLAAIYQTFNKTNRRLVKDITSENGSYAQNVPTRSSNVNSTIPTTKRRSRSGQTSQMRSISGAGY